MRNIIKIFFILLLIVVIGCIGFIGYLGFTGGFQIMDGDGMIYDWKANNLYGTWTGVDGSTLSIDEDKIVLNADTTYDILYDIDENSSSPKVKLKTSNPYEYFMFVDEDGCFILSGFIQDENERYVIINEFVNDKCNTDVDSSFKSKYREKYEQSMYLNQPYSIGNALDSVNYLNRTKNDLGIENNYIEDNGNFYTVTITSSLFDMPVEGIMYSEMNDELGLDDLVVDEIDYYSSISFDDLYNRFIELYTIVDEGEEPYATNGQPSRWATFDVENASIRLTEKADSDRVMIQFKKK